MPRTCRISSWPGGRGVGPRTAFRVGGPVSLGEMVAFGAGLEALRPREASSPAEGGDSAVTRAERAALRWERRTGAGDFASFGLAGIVARRLRLTSSSLSTTMMASGETWRAYLLKKDAESESVLAERATTFELRTPFEARGPPAADPAAGTETMPVDGRLLRVDVVWQPCVSRTESGSLSNQARRP